MILLFKYVVKDHPEQLKNGDTEQQQILCENRENIMDGHHELQKIVCQIKAPEVNIKRTFYRTSQ